MLLDTCRNRQNIGIENDVVLIKADFIHKNPISPFTDTDLFLVSSRLTLFIEGHHHDSSTILHDVLRVLLKNFLAFFKRD